MKYQEILHRCFRCGYCKLPSSYKDINCPSYLKYRFETYSPGGRMWLLKAWLDEEIKTSPHFAEILYSCAACGNCVEHCVFPKFKADLLNAFVAGREELVDQGAIPGIVSDYFKAIQLYGNPYKLPEEKRDAWAEGIGVPCYTNEEFLLYIGCPGSFDERGQKMARAVASLLAKFEVSFGILGKEEHCDGNEVKILGESGLFEVLARNNIEQFRKKGVKKVVTLSPHAYHAMRNEYPKYGAEFEVFHYTHLLARFMDKGDLLHGNSRIKVTFHDPCYLGRHNADYYTPRTILNAVPGIELVEMDRNKGDALCCGGGGGNFFTDILGSGTESSSRVRIREAIEVGADILAVACPKCAKMFEDAIKAEDQEDKIKVRDIAEIILDERL
ncbi:MAG: (Fe-S)-binding protein [Deltaproteobacteria bacterium]|nr:(Fe-S)-binding protein [Candidatus Zymogenaceae bacterium]